MFVIYLRFWEDTTSANYVCQINNFKLVENLNDFKQLNDESLLTHNIT